MPAQLPETPDHDCPQNSISDPVCTSPVSEVPQQGKPAAKRRTSPRKGKSVAGSPPDSSPPPSVEVSKDVYRVENGVLTLFVHVGQNAILNAPERVVLALCGSQSGKTSVGPLWLLFEIMKTYAVSGESSYAVVAPTFPLMELKCIPEFRRLFEDTLKLGKYYQAPIRKFVFSEHGLMTLFGSTEKPCVVYFGFAENPDSLESATLKAVWCDEAGQRKFRLDSWDAINRRLTVNQGRILVTTTPYEHNWLKSRVSDKAGTEEFYDSSEGRMVEITHEGGDPSIRVVRFESILNPAFSIDEFERQRAMLPEWKFDMMFRGVWRKPAGAIYDCFSETDNVVPPFHIPAHWPRVVGVDFGQVNTAAANFAVDPETGVFYLYKTYHTGRKSVEEHVGSILLKEPTVPMAYGGAAAENDWRKQFAMAGLPVQLPHVTDVEAGIDAVYAAIKSGRLKVFSHLYKVVDDLFSYSRKLDSNGEITEQIEDKNKYHRLDAVRYAVVELMRGGFTGPSRVSSLNWSQGYRKL
jgi:hypothetical protein